MINNIKILVFLICFLLLSLNNIYSKTNFLVSAGISQPNKELSNIFNSNSIKTTDSLNPSLNVINPDFRLAYNITAKLIFDISDDAEFFGSFGLIKFAKFNFNLNNPLKNENAGYVESQTSIYPISVGINYYLIKNPIYIYGIGNLSYNFIVNTYISDHSKFALTIGRNNTDSRLGFSLGLGFEIPLEQASIILETIYTNLNYIGKSSNEDTKSLINISAGFRF